MVRPTAFGRALAAQRIARGMTRAAFADVVGVPDKHLQRYEYRGRGCQPDKAARIARALGLPSWHFEAAITLDRMQDGCRVGEVTAVVVGLERYVLGRLPGEQWASVRAKLLEGM